MLREHQQPAIVDLDGPVDLLDEFLAPLHVFRSEPDPQLFATHLLVPPPSELIVLAAIADEARLILNRLHRPDERRQVGDGILKHATATSSRFRELFQFQQGFLTRGIAIIGRCHSIAFDRETVSSEHAN